MPSLLAVGAALSAGTALVVFVINVQDEGAQGEQTAAQLAGFSLVVSTAAVFLPLGIVAGIEALVPFRTIRGRRLSTFTDELAAVASAGAGAYFVWVAHEGRFVDPESAATSPDALRHTWMTLGVAVILSSVLTVVLVN